MDYLLLFFICVIVLFMIFLPFKFFFLKHRKPSALVILVSVPGFEQPGPEKDLAIFEKTLAFPENGLFTARCDCHVMLRHPAYADALRCSDWLITCFLEFDWLKTNYPVFS